MHKIKETKEAKKDVKKLASYMIHSLKNEQAARSFLDCYDKHMHTLVIFPFAYRDIGIQYRGYKIRIRPFLSYNILFVVDSRKQQITILRVLKDRQNWNNILHSEDVYSF